MPDESHPPAHLAPDRTFIIHLDSTAGEHHLSGRVEHAWSGRVVEFDSAAALLDFLGQTIRTMAASTSPSSSVVTDAVSGLGLAPPMTDIAPALLQERFGLTAAESLLAHHLAAGHSLAESAARLGISLYTASVQLKSVLRQTQTKRQRELVRLLLGSSKSTA